MTALTAIGRKVFCAVIRVYQWIISPLFPASCRYAPSCSQYALEAVARFGTVRGGWLAVKRILRCHPWGGAGLDPVPELAAEDRPAGHRHL